MRKVSYLGILSHKVIVVFAISIFTCCSDYDIWEFNEEFDIIDYKSLNVIANSQEYIEFQKQSYLYMEEIQKHDSAQMVFVDTICGRPLYTSTKIYSLKQVFDAIYKLSKSYPEYNTTTAEERAYILNIALSNDNTLIDIINGVRSKQIPMTKSGNYESDALRWIYSVHSYEMITNENGCTDLVAGANSMWSVLGMTLYTYENYVNAMYDAVNLSRRYHTEYGGLSWDFTDQSGILIQDPYATISSMHIPNTEGAVCPTFDFHVHPSGNLNPSSTDYASWAQLPWREHHIINYEYQESIHAW